jgi:parallel beta-helix repeat protein
MSEEPADSWCASVVIFENGESDASVLEGFTLTGGKGCPGAGPSPFVPYGGGVFCKGNSSPTLSGCTITGNSAAQGGGVWGWDNSSPTLTNCTISGNVASSGGGVSGSATLTNV